MTTKKASVSAMIDVACANYNGRHRSCECFDLASEDDISKMLCDHLGTCDGWGSETSCINFKEAESYFEKDEDDECDGNCPCIDLCDEGSGMVRETKWPKIF